MNDNERSKNSKRSKNSETQIRIVLISGTPGTGKTTIAKLISEKKNWPMYSLTEVVLKNKLYMEYDEERDSYVVDPEKIKEYFIDLIESMNIIRIEKSSAKSEKDKEKSNTNSKNKREKNDKIDKEKKNKKKKNKTIIIEGHYSDLIDLPLDTIAFVLRCHPITLEKRLRKRPYSEEKIRENIQAELVGDCAEYFRERTDLIEKKKVFEIDTSQSTKEKIISQIIEILNEPAKYKNYILGTISWLSDPSVPIERYF